MKKIISVTAVLLSSTTLLHAETVDTSPVTTAATAPVVVPSVKAASPIIVAPVANTPIEASTFFEVGAGIVSLNKSKADERGYDSKGASVNGSVGIILGHVRIGAGAMAVVPADQNYNNFVDEEGFEVVDADIGFTGFNAFAGGRYLYLDKYEFNLDIGLTTMGDFQISDKADQQEASLDSSGGLFIRPSFNYYITSFLGVHVSYLQMIGSDTTVRSMLSAGTVLKL